MRPWPVPPPPGRRRWRPPVNFAPVEGFGVEGDGGGVAALGTADGDFPAQLHPGNGEDGAGVGAGQREDVLLVVLQQTQDSWGGGTGWLWRMKRVLISKDIKSILLDPVALI